MSGSNTILDSCREFMCSPSCAPLCAPLCAPVHVLLHVLPFMCSPMCSSMCTPSCTPICAPLCALLYAPLHVLLMCTPMCFPGLLSHWTHCACFSCLEPWQEVAAKAPGFGVLWGHGAGMTRPGLVSLHMVVNLGTPMITSRHK